VSKAEQWLASDKTTVLMGYVTVLLVASTMVLAILFVPNIASNTEASRRTDDLASCRAEFRAKIDEANFQVSIALGEAQSGLSDAVVASIRQDPTTLALIAAEITTAEDRKAEAYVQLKLANDAYGAAVELSNEDPDEFLRQCAE
jgi:hypothetical protein